MDHTPASDIGNNHNDRQFFAKLMEASRKNLLDLSLRNRLLNYSPADPEHRDDGRAHKFLVVRGRLKASWERLVGEAKQLHISRFNPTELAEMLKRLNESLRKAANKNERDLIRTSIKEVQDEIEAGESLASEGHVWVEKLGEEAYQKRLRRLRDEAKSLEDATGDSAFFLAFGFLKWPERPRPNRSSVDPANDGVSTARFAPLLLIKVSLTDEGKGSPGRRKFRIVPEDDPQDNQSLVAKLREEWQFTLPPFNENLTLVEYFATVRRAITVSKLSGFEVQETLALGFFNFARYRLWLDLDPKQWKGFSPEAHPIVRSILSVEPLDVSCPRIIDATRDDAIADEIARHQESEDIPVVRDADASQYSALLYARKGKSMVVIGPPGSGKSQTITNLIAASIGNGKRVLFVAQKLPALDVVARRLRDAGLGEFCLQFYSAKQDGEPDRKPVSPIQIHAQLNSARNLLGNRGRSGIGERRAPVLAKKLNNYANAVHSLHEVYGESIQHLLCVALKLREDAEGLWGESWDESLLSVAIPEGSALSLEWRELRTKFVTEIARLNREAGEFWKGWEPTKLTALDLPKVERAINSQHRSLRGLIGWCDEIGEAISDWPLSQLRELAEKAVEKSVPDRCSDEFIRAVLGSAHRMREAHELERELKSAEAAAAQGEKVFTFLPEGAGETGRFVLGHLTPIESGVAIDATFLDAQETLAKIGELLRSTDVLLESLPRFAEGIAAFYPEYGPSVSMALLVQVAQQPDGNFRRPPDHLLPAFGRLLVENPNLADGAIIISDQVENLVRCRQIARELFSQSIRAENAITDEFVVSLTSACETGISEQSVVGCEIVESAASALSAVSEAIRHADPGLAAAMAAPIAGLTISHLLELAAANQLSSLVLVAPSGCVPRVVRAWADGLISEDEARTAANAQDRAAAVLSNIEKLVDDGERARTDVGKIDCALRAVAELGVEGSVLSELRNLDAEMESFERLFRTFRAEMEQWFGFQLDESLGGLRGAIEAAHVFDDMPSLSHAEPDILREREKLGDVRLAVARVLQLRKEVGVGLMKTLSAAGSKIRNCMAAANAAESGAGRVTGIRRPTTLRELRAVGAAIPLLRAMPALPVGCDPVATADEQRAATILLLHERALKLTERIVALPRGTDFQALPTSREAFSHLRILREKSSNKFRFFSSEWRVARSALKRFAPNLIWDEAMSAFSAAAQLLEDDEELATDAAGATVLNAYHRGRKTDWQPFLAFAKWAQELAKVLDGFERNDRIVAVWRSESGGVNVIGNACAQFDEAASQCRAEWPELFAGADGPFQNDVTVEDAKLRTSEVLKQIDTILSSPVLQIADFHELSADQMKPLPRLLEDALRAEADIRSASSVAQRFLGSTFAGTPREWLLADEIAAWALKIHDSRCFSQSLATLFSVCVTQPSAATKVTLDAKSLEKMLSRFAKDLARGRVRADNRSEVGAFVGAVRAKLGEIKLGASVLKGVLIETTETLSTASLLLHEYETELSRSERLRTAIAPNIPTSASVEVSLGWALAVARHGLPKKVVGYLAEHSAKSKDVTELVELSAIFAERLGGLKSMGCSSAPWLLQSSTIQEVSEGAKHLAATLSAARTHAKDCGAKSGSTIAQLRHGSAAVRDGTLLQRKSKEWESALGCDPFAVESPAEAIRETIYWVESLHADRIPPRLMLWLVAENSDDRVRWWATTVRAARGWKTLRGTIRQSSLPEFESVTELDAWRSALSARRGSLSAALSELGRILRSPGHSLVKMRAAAEALKESEEASNRATSLRSRIPGAIELKSSADLASHRAYAASIAGLPVEVSSWLLEVGSEVSSKQLSLLPDLLDREACTWEGLATMFRMFGDCEPQGPSGILAEDQPVRSSFRGITNAVSHLHEVSSWASLIREIKRSQKLGVARLAEMILERKASDVQAGAAFNAAVAWQKALVVWQENPALERFRSSRHEDLRTEFSQEDAAAIKTHNRSRIVAVLKEQTGGGMASWGNGGVDQLLLHEGSKRRKLMPVRKLVEAAGKRIQELCPCWLATPAAIAQFMAPGSTDFDLIIMDEASQLTPEDSWGAIARGRQVVIVGDPRQMPPSSFFEHAAAEDEDEDITDEAAKSDKPIGQILKGHQQESVLKAAEACLPQVWLNWHYRSLHQGLIAPANALSYDRRLVLFPSSHVNHHHLGVRRHFIADGLATTGQVKNANEAAAIVDRLVTIAADFAAASHHRLSKAPHSVGVIAMNIHQQEIIKDLIESRKSGNAQFEHNMSLLEGHETEPFFVRNLENVQGDERDVILISTTYAPNTPGGTPTQRFFPINQEGGERRFNVLITRSKWRMEVFTSLRSAQLTSSQLGVQHMRSFLEYCETEKIPDRGADSGRSIDSPFEAHVKAVLEARGYSVTPQVGVAGYFVDLAIKDPLAPDRYLLGIECDGATYHSSRCARDRDRLREQVLEERGWRLHRIWSTEWFYNNAAVRRELFAAVEAALPGNR